MIKVGVVGLGMMGVTHLDVYAKRSDVSVVAVADTDPDRRSGKTLARGNVEGQAAGAFDVTKVHQYSDGLELIADPQIELVDICLATPLHHRFAIAALRAGKHVLVEKPLARTSVQADEIVDEARKSGVIAMPAMCLRFWPGWTWLKAAIAEQRYGKVLAAQFRRLGAQPPGPFYTDGRACGGAALDLHIHDTDFIQFCFGKPKAVVSHGYAGTSGCIDHLITHYQYDDVPLVTAEGGWIAPDGFPFTMQYTVHFQRATAVYDLAAADKLKLYQKGKPAEAVAIDTRMGYELEIDYLLDCIRNRQSPSVVTLADAADAVRLVEAEIQSIAAGQAVPVD